MFAGSKKLLICIFLFIFLVTFIVGMASDVSFAACFGRSILYAVSFAGLIWLALTSVQKFVLFDLIDDMKSKSDFETVAAIDVKAGEDLTLEDVFHSIGQSTVNNSGVSEMAATTQKETTKPKETNKPKEEADNGTVAPQQINPQVSKIIESDPERVAEIVRKMGFEEE